MDEMSYGGDIKIDNTTNDLIVGNGDLIVAIASDSIYQYILLALKTRLGEIESLPIYGNATVGSRSKNTTNSLNKIYSDCLSAIRNVEYVSTVEKLEVTKININTCSIHFVVKTIYNNTITGSSVIEG